MGISEVGSFECGSVFMVSKKHMEFLYLHSDHYLLKMDFASWAYVII
jgi:hypothetical protein